MLDGSGPELCRISPTPMPSIREHVMSRVVRYENNVYYVRLSEYDNVEALLPSSSIAAKRAHNLSSHFRIGEELVLEVARVDVERNFIDLDQRSITQDDVEACRQAYIANGTLHSLMRHVAISLHVPKLIILYKIFGWPVGTGRFKSSYAAFRHASLSFDEVFNDIIDDYYANGYQAASNDPDIGTLVTIEELASLRETVPKEQLVECLRTTIMKRLKPKTAKLTCGIRLTSFYDVRGVEVIKDAIRAGLKYAEENPLIYPAGFTPGPDELPLRIRLNVAPLYTVSLQTIFPQEGKDLIERTTKVIQEAITGAHGRYELERAVTVTETETSN